MLRRRPPPPGSADRPGAARGEACWEGAERDGMGGGTGQQREPSAGGLLSTVRLPYQRDNNQSFAAGEQWTGVASLREWTGHCTPRIPTPLQLVPRHPQRSQPDSSLPPLVIAGRRHPSPVTRIPPTLQPIISHQSPRHPSHSYRHRAAVDVDRPYQWRAQVAAAAH